MVVWWHHFQIDPKDGKIEEVKSNNTCGITYGLAGMMDGTLDRIGARRSGGLGYGFTSVDIMARKGDRFWGYQLPYGAQALSQDISVARTTSKPADKDFVWRTPFGTNIAYALALCDNGLLLAGRKTKPKGDEPVGFLTVLNADTGQRTFELPLPAAPVHQGVAVVEGKVFLSLQDGTLTCLGAP
jgi:hypothetical protein